MGKVTRYFNHEETPNKSVTSNSDVITYEINPKPQAWGRKQADKREKFNKNRQNKRPLPVNKTIVRLSNPNPKFKGKKYNEVSKELLKKYGKGEGVDLKGVKTTIHQKRIERKEKNIKYATEQAARTEILLTEESGYLEADSGETTTQFTQNQIAKNVDITAATKHFDLKLNDFGPYRMKYTKNGRHMVLGGRRGHVAAFDWVTKKLHCELNVMESVHDVSWLHIETMLAVAQKEWVYIYDNQGIELHCLKRLNKVTRMEFLPYHFLLATCSEEGYLSWLDVSIGQIVNRYSSKLGRLSIMTQNPWNAVLCVGQSKGVVSMWSPNSHEPLAKMLCHKAPITGMHIDPKGMYMATAASNRELKIWDIRKLEGPLQQYKLVNAANNLNFSQKNMLAVGMGNVVEVYKDCCVTAAKKPYLRHRFVTPIGNMNFCPYEDVLGVATARGFTSLLVPGSGEPNFDSYEANPFQSKTQRREAEVKALLEKIQPELITLDPTSIAEVDLPTLKDKMDAKTKLLHVKAPKINYEPRNKAKGKGGSVKIAKNKKIVQAEAKKEFIKSTKDLIPQPTNEVPVKEKPPSVFDRFIVKKK